METFLKELPDSNTAKAYRKPYGVGKANYVFKTLPLDGSHQKIS